VFAAALLLAAVAQLPPVVLDRPVPKLHIGIPFREALQQDISATWDNVPLRLLLQRLQAERSVALLLDRRIDPTVAYAVRFAGEPLATALEHLANQAGAAVSHSDRVVYLGPESSARWLQTAVEQAELRLAEEGLAVAERRRFALLLGQTIHWQDLSTPREILQQIAASFHLTIEGLEAVPHDLWASATLPGVTAAEALTLVLIQFDLGWDWLPGGNSVRVKPWDQPRLIERRYPLRSKAVAEVVPLWSEHLPEAVVRAEGDAILVAGRTEDHRLAQVLRTTGAPPKRSSAAASPVPLRRRLFTLKVERVPIGTILRELEKTQVQFVYDPAALEQAGISLEQPISLDVRKASAEEFFEAVFGGVGLRFEIDNLTVTLRPK